MSKQWKSGEALSMLWEERRRVVSYIKCKYISIIKHTFGELFRLENILIPKYFVWSLKIG